VLWIRPDHPEARPLSVLEWPAAAQVASVAVPVAGLGDWAIGNGGIAKAEEKKEAALMIQRRFIIVHSVRSREKWYTTCIVRVIHYFYVDPLLKEHVSLLSTGIGSD
jgi:hypothetical protein